MERGEYGLRDMVSFRGRLDRTSFLFAVLSLSFSCVILFTIVIGIGNVATSKTAADPSISDAGIRFIFYGLGTVSIAYFLVLFALLAQRLHDMNRSAVPYLLFLTISLAIISFGAVPDN